MGLIDINKQGAFSTSGMRDPSIQMTPEEFKKYMGVGKKNPAQKRKHEEDSLQIACVKYWCKQYPGLWRLFPMVKNDGFKKRTVLANGKSFSHQANMDKIKNLVPGISDNIILIPNAVYGGLFVEFKTEKGVQSLDQHHFENIIKILNYKYVVIKSLEGFINVVNEYLKTADWGKINFIQKMESEFMEK